VAYTASWSCMGLRGRGRFTRRTVLPSTSKITCTHHNHIMEAVNRCKALRRGGAEAVREGKAGNESDGATTDTH
jgi:hypothetical protein